jgi:alpha-amylase
MNYETFGEMQNAGTGIFEFLKALRHFASQMGINFETPSMVLQKRKPIDQSNAPYPISWADEERDLSAWLGNELQRSAFDKLYGIGERVRLSNDRRLMQDWYYLQSSDHFYYMSTKHFSDGAMHSHFSPYDTPYEAFMNYMNVLSDFIDRVNGQFPEGVDNEELNSLLKTIDAQGELIANLEKQLHNVTVTAPKKKTAKKC